MAWDSEKNLRRLEELLSAGGSKLLFYHHDADGICSAALMLKFYPGLKPIPLEGPRLGDVMKGIEKAKPSAVIFVDLPVDQEPKNLAKLKAITKVAVIDHHIADSDLNRKGMLHMNPKLDRDVYLPTSYLVYKLLEKLGKRPRDFKWISCTGIYGDYGLKDCASFIRGCGMELDDMRLGAGLISSAVTLKGLRGCEAALRQVLKSESFKQFSKSIELRSWKMRVNKEFKDIMERFNGSKELYPDAGLVIYEITSRLNLTSAVSNRLSEMLPSFVVMIVKKSGSMWKLSLRNQAGKVNLGLIIKMCTKGIGSGGGHPKAAGALVSDYGKFKERLLAELSRHFTPG